MNFTLRDVTDQCKPSEYKTQDRFVNSLGLCITDYFPKCILQLNSRTQFIQGQHLNARGLYAIVSKALYEALELEEVVFHLDKSFVRKPGNLTGIFLSDALCQRIQVLSTPKK